MDFPNPIICICSQVIYPHLSESVVFFTAHQSEFICPTHFHSALLTVWWMVTERNIWWWMVIWWIKGWSIAGFLPKRNCIYQLQSSAFADRWYPHLLEFQPLLLTYLSPYLTAEFGVAFVNKQLKKNNILFSEPSPTSQLSPLILFHGTFDNKYIEISIKLESLFC